MTNETNDQGTRDAAAILAELMDAVDALAESWRGEADTYRDRRQFAAADAIGAAARAQGGGRVRLTAPGAVLRRAGCARCPR